MLRAFTRLAKEASFGASRDLQLLVRASSFSLVVVCMENKALNIFQSRMCGKQGTYETSLAYVLEIIDLMAVPRFPASGLAVGEPNPFPVRSRSPMVLR